MKFYYRSICLALCFYLFSCNDHQKVVDKGENALTEEQIKELKSLKEAFSGLKEFPEGKEVSFGDVMGCVFYYDSVMRVHGFDSVPPVNTTITANTWKKVTYSIDFGDAKLMAFLVKKIAALKELFQGKNVGIKLVIGMYTKEFIAKYSLPANSEGRISVFVVPVKEGEEIIVQKIRAKDDGTIDNSRPAYNLGGVHP